MWKLSRSRSLSIIALLTAVAIVLNFVVTIPAPYADFLFYEVWEVPILLAVLILGFRDGATVAVLNTILLEAYKQGPLPTGPLYNLISQLSMFLGVLLVVRLAQRSNWRESTLVIVATASGALFRTGISTVYNGIILPLPYPVGYGSFGVTEAQVPALLVLIAIFNITVTLYTVPLAFTVRKAIESRVPSFQSGVRPK